MVIWTFKWGNITFSMYMHVVSAKFCFIIVNICFKIWNSSFYHKYMVIWYAQQSCRSSSSRWWTRLSIKVYHIYTRICVKNTHLLESSILKREVMIRQKALVFVHITRSLYIWNWSQLSFPVEGRHRISHIDRKLQTSKYLPVRTSSRLLQKCGHV